MKRRACFLRRGRFDGGRRCTRCGWWHTAHWNPHRTALTEYVRWWLTSYLPH